MQKGTSPAPGAIPGYGPVVHTYMYICTVK